MAKKYIHVNPRIIKQNTLLNQNHPTIVIKQRDSRNKVKQQEANEVIIYGQDGLEAARIVYGKNDVTNARVWIEADNIKIIK